MTCTDHKTILMVIPARGGSKGIPRKNLSEIGGIPLVGRTVKVALESQHDAEVIVSTDDDEIAAVAIKYGARVIKRPAELSSDTASSESAVLHAVETFEKSNEIRVEIALLLQCTAPFITSEDIDGVIAPLIEGNAQSAFAAMRFNHFVWHSDPCAGAMPVNHDGGPRLRRQDLKPQYLEAGSVYAMEMQSFKADGHRFCGRTAIHEVSGSYGFEIDDPDDLRLARAFAEQAHIPSRIKRRNFLSRSLDAATQTAKFIRFAVRLRHIFVPQEDVSIVGGSPALKGSNLGAEIDKSGTVVRINFQDFHHTQSDCGTKTTVRWLGANLSEKHVSKLKQLGDEVIVSTTKNQHLLESLGLVALYYDSRILNQVFKLFLLRHGLFRDIGSKKPLRTGSNVLFCFWLIGLKTAKIFGFSNSDDTEERIYAISADASLPVSTTRILLDANHMPLLHEKKIEHKLLRQTRWKVFSNVRSS